MVGIGDRIIRLEATLERIERLLELHEKQIQGNGVPGCMIRIDRIEHALEQNTRHISGILKSVSGIKRTVMLTTGGMVVIMFMIANKDFFAHLLK